MSAAYRLSGHPQSTCTRRVLCTAKELGLELPLTLIDLGKGEQKNPEYMKKAIWGVVPLLETADGSWSLYESRAICRFLATKYKDANPTLLGRTAEEYALIEQWMSVEASNFDTSAGSLVGELVFKPMRGKQPDPVVEKTLVEKLNRVLDVYEGHLAAKGTPYLVGEEFTLADLVHIPYGSMVIGATPYADAFKSRPNVWKWWERITSRPSWKAVSA